MSESTEKPEVESPEPGSGLNPKLVNLLLVFFSLVFALVLVGGVETALRLLGLGAPDASQTSRLKYQQIYLPILEPAERPDGVEVWRPTDSRLPHQEILRDKPADALRVFTFGGSATAGLGFSPNVTFARHLQRMLVEAYPERTVEVMNLGIVALSSKQVKLLVQDALAYEPDLLVVYSGNNEFLEIHAEKLASARATLRSRFSDSLQRLHLHRVISRAVHGPPQRPSLAEQNFSRDDLRMTQNQIIQEIEMSEDDIAGILDQYERNIADLTASAQAADVPILLTTVAANWQWRGREDLPESWIAELAGDAQNPLEAARAKVDAGLDAAADDERYEWLYRRAVLATKAGEYDLARDSYRAAMNEDPHLRRALDAANDRVLAVGERAGVATLDTVSALMEHDEHGVVGFPDFYDYVHFTPRGATLTAGAMFSRAVETGLLPQPADFDPQIYVEARLQQIAQRRDGALPDAFEVGEFLGYGWNFADFVADRDLWKYDRFVAELDDRLEASPDDAQALVYRGVAAYYRLDGADDARRDWRAAIERLEDPSLVEANLQLLDSEARP